MCYQLGNKMLFEATVHYLSKERSLNSSCNPCCVCTPFPPRSCCYAGIFFYKWKEEHGLHLDMPLSYHNQDLFSEGILSNNYSRRAFEGIIFHVHLNS